MILDKLKKEPILKDHQAKDVDIYRLRCVNFHNGKKHPENYGFFDIYTKSFKLPLGMNLLDAFKVLSYLIDYFEKNFNIPKFSSSCFNMLDKALNFEELGFQRLNEYLCDDEVNDLFMVTGNLEKFKESANYLRYFNWYIPNVSKEEIKEIYEINKRRQRILKLHN